MYPNPQKPFCGIAVYQAVKYLQRMRYKFEITYPIAKPPFPINRIKRFRDYDKLFPATLDHEGIAITFPRFIFSYRLVPNRNWGELLWFSCRKKFLSDIKRYKPDLLWCQPGIPQGWATMKISRKTGIPYVIVIHGWDMNEARHLPGSAEKLKQIYENAAMVIPVSQKLEREAREVAPSANFRRIYFGLDTEMIPPNLLEDRRKHMAQQHDRDIVILSVCNLIKTKGIQYNLEVFARLKKEFPNLKYRVVGDGDYGHELRLSADRLGIVEDVEFLGQKGYLDSKIEMAGADIFSMPSYKEGIPMVYFEAMYLELPVIGCKGLVDELITDGVNGFLVEPHDTEELYNKMKRLIENVTIRQATGQNARKTILDHFTYEKSVKMFDRAFREIINQPDLY